jgi:glucosamine 6-phosphate synthetase-like amidotransferase/phosphosugar isomerase protein
MADNNGAALNRAIGSLEADAKTRQRQTETIFKDMKEITKGIADLRSDVRQVLEDQEATDKKVASHAVTIEEYKKFRNMGRGISVAIAVAFSGIGATLVALVLKLTGNGS